MLDYGEQGRRRGRASPAPSSPTRCTTWPPSCSAARREWGVEPGALDAARAFVAHLPRRRPSWPRWPASEGPATSTTTSSWCRTRSAASPTTRSGRSPSTSTATTPTSPRTIITGLAEMGGFGLSVPEEYGGYGERRRERVHRHGRRHRGAVARLARRRRLADHPARDPRPGRCWRAAPRSRSSEWLPKLATGRGHGRGGGHRARLRLRRRRHEGHRHAATDGGWLDQRREDVVHVRGAGRRADAAGPHRPRPLARPTAACRMFIVPKPRGDGPRLRVRAGRQRRRPGREDGGPRRSTPSATAACTPTRSRSTTGSCRPTT